MVRGRKKVRCRYCGYEWYARVENPKECPLCKRYLISPHKSKSSNNTVKNKRRKRR